VARATGGVQEIIEDYDPTMDPPKAGYGFLCYEYSSEAFWDAIKRTREIFRDPPLWTTLVERAMARNFSWDKAAQRYEQVYAELVGETDEAVA
jgi:starch synthase